MDRDAHKQYADSPTESLSAPLAARLRTNALYQVRNRLDNAHGATDNFAKANHVPPELLESLRAGEDVSRHLSLFPEDVSGPLTALVRMEGEFQREITCVVIPSPLSNI